MNGIVIKQYLSLFVCEEYNTFITNVVWLNICKYNFVIYEQTSNLAFESRLA